MTDKPFAWEVKCQVADEDEVALFVGLHPKVAGAVATAVDGYAGNAIGFWVKDDTDFTVKALTKTSASAETTTQVATSMGDATMHTFGCEYNGVDTVRFYFDGSLAATHTTNIPASTAYLAPTVAMATKEGATKALKVEYMAFATYRA